MIKLENGNTLVIDTRHYENILKIKIVHRDKPPKYYYRQQDNNEDEMLYTVDKLLRKENYDYYLLNKEKRLFDKE